MKILTGGCWPEFTSSSKFLPPTELKSLVNCFNEFYKQKHNESRALNWTVSEGSAELGCNYKDNKKYQFVVSNIQMVILFEIAKCNQISFENLKINTLISEIDLIQSLEALIQLKIVFRSKDMNEKFNPTDILQLNLDFSHPSKRILCNIPLKKGKGVGTTTEAEKEKDNGASDIGAVQQERSSLIDAAIVRVMKSRKTMKLNDLLTDVVKILHLFRPLPVQIKARIESLIERGYMKRDEKDMGVFIYLP